MDRNLNRIQFKTFICCIISYNRMVIEERKSDTMKWFKKQFNKFFYINDEEQEEQYDTYEEYETDDHVVKDHFQQQSQPRKSTFRFPLISDEEVLPESPKQPMTETIVSKDKKNLELPKYLQQPTSHVYDVEVSGIRELLERRQKGRGYSQVIRSNNKLAKERQPVETEYVSKNKINNQPEVNNEFTNPLQNRKRFVPTSVPSPVYGFAKPKPIEELLPKKQEQKQNEEVAINQQDEMPLTQQEAIKEPLVSSTTGDEIQVKVDEFVPHNNEQTTHHENLTMEVFTEEQAPNQDELNTSYYEQPKNSIPLTEEEASSEQLSELKVEHLTIENSTIHIGQLNVEQSQQSDLLQMENEEVAATNTALMNNQNSGGSKLPFNVLMLKSDKQKIMAKQMVKNLLSKQEPTLKVNAEPENDLDFTSVVKLNEPLQSDRSEPSLEMISSDQHSSFIQEENADVPSSIQPQAEINDDMTEVHHDEKVQLNPEIVLDSQRVEMTEDVKASNEEVEEAISLMDSLQQKEEVIVDKPVQQEIKQYDMPSSEFLSPPEEKIEDLDWMEEQADALVEALSYHQVSAQVESIMQGPAVTQFEITIGHGTKVSKIRNLSDDLKLALAAKDIRIQAPIPGKRTIGIEIPNLTSRAVRLSEVTNSASFKESDSPLEAALGLDLTGKPVSIDLRKMPHGLIAGATGSGKSVCINSILVSLLYKAKPHELKLMLIDPKMVELAPFNHIPHLVSPVITDVKAAAAALSWAVEEMERRYQLFMHAEVRDITRYNAIAEANGQPALKLPYLLIVIDELADLMMMAPADVEDAICRIAQKARACGIHLIVATQRPSTDVITGLIKANIPTRIAFSVSSQIDSRTILDMQGAERLLGRGDMLYLGNGMSAPQRIQGTFVTDDEIEDIIAYVRSQGEPDYMFEQDELIKKVEMVEEQDELFEEVCRFVYDQGTASTSSIQRKYHIGYNRAARLVDMLEKHGFVSEQRGSKPRESYITESDLMSLFD